MTQEIQSTPAPARPVRRRRWFLLGGVVVTLTVAAALAVIFWPRRHLPEPALPDLTGVDPEVVDLVQKTRQQVLNKPSDPHAWGRLAMVYLANGFEPLAEQPLQVAEQLDPKEPRWVYLRGVQLLLSDPDKGIKLLKRAVELSHHKPLAPRQRPAEALVPQLRLAEALLENGKLDEAESQLQEALKRLPSSHRAQVDLARLAMLRQQWQAVLKRLEPVMDDPSARKQAHMMRAQALIHLKQPERAHQEQQQAAALPPDNGWPDPYVDYVLTLARGLNPRLGAVDMLAQRDVQQALRTLQQLVVDYPESVEVWVRLAETQRRTGDLRGAEQSLQRALEIDPQASEAWFRLGSLRLTDHPREAADCFRRAIGIKADHALAHYNLGLCLEKLGDRTGAADEFRASLRCRPDYDPAQAALKRLTVKKP